jgi:hypothetical protein
MSKLQGLKFLQKQFEFNGHQMAHVLLYKNLPADKIADYQLGLGRMVLIAMECGDICWALGLIRDECQHGIAGTEPEGYDPFFNGDGNPPLDEPRPYDAYTEMGWYLWPDETPHGLGLDLSKSVLDAVGSLLVSKAGLKSYSDAQGMRLMTRDSDEDEFRPMTDAEITKHSRREESEVMEGCVFTVGFNEDIARLRQLVAERGSLTEILDLIGPAPVEDDPF